MDAVRLATVLRESGREGSAGVEGSKREGVAAVAVAVDVGRTAARMSDLVFYIALAFIMLT